MGIHAAEGTRRRVQSRGTTRPTTRHQGRQHATVHRACYHTCMGGSNRPSGVARPPPTKSTDNPYPSDGVRDIATDSKRQRPLARRPHPEVRLRHFESRHRTGDGTAARHHAGGRFLRGPALPQRKRCRMVREQRQHDIPPRRRSDCSCGMSATPTGIYQRRKPFISARARGRLGRGLCNKTLAAAHVGHRVRRREHSGISRYLGIPCTCSTALMCGYRTPCAA